MIFVWTGRGEWIMYSILLSGGVAVGLDQWLLAPGERIWPYSMAFGWLGCSGGTGIARPLQPGQARAQFRDGLRAIQAPEPLFVLDPGRILGPVLPRAGGLYPRHASSGSGAMTINRVPVRQWKHREFGGPDPWAANRPTRWSVVVFRMVPKSMVERASCDAQCVSSDSNEIPRKYAIGIYAEGNGRYRILPRAVADAWRRHEIPDQNLPGLLYQGEEKLRLKDDLPGPPQGLALVHAVVVAGTALGIFAFYVRLLILAS